MNIAITGGNGFIGSNLTNMISNIGHNVILISRKKDPANKNSYSFDDFFNYNIDQEMNCFIHLASPNYDYSRDSSLIEGITNLTTKILKLYLNIIVKYFFSSAKIYGEPSLARTVFSENQNLCQSQIMEKVKC